MVTRALTRASSASQSSFSYYTLPVSAKLQGIITGRVYLDSNNDNVVTAGIDEGFEGIVVNVFRIAGITRTFLGCTQTDGTGEQ